MMGKIGMTVPAESECYNDLVQFHGVFFSYLNDKDKVGIYLIEYLEKDPDTGNIRLWKNLEKENMPGSCE